MRNLSNIIILVFVQIALFAQEPLADVNSLGEIVDDNLFSISGTLLDKDTKEPILFASVAVYDTESKLITGTESGIDGKYHIQNIKAGSYTLEAIYIGYTTTRTEQISIIDKDLNEFDISLTEGGIAFCCGCIWTDFEVKLIDISNPSYITTFTANDIASEYQDQNNSWNLHFTIHEKTKKSKKEKREKRKQKKKAKIKESSTEQDVVQNKFDDNLPEEIIIKQNQQEAKVNIFPNPSTGLINIESSLPITDINIVNLQGQSVNQFALNSEYNQRLDFSILGSGLYFIHIQYEGGRLVRQVSILD